MVDAKEIVGALRECVGGTEGIKITRAAADLIESLQAQLAEYDEIAAEYGIDGKTMLTLAKSQIKTAQDNVELMEQLEESQRRADAAVEDMKLIVDAVREEHCDGTCCFACAFDCDTSINDSGVPNCECPGFERDDCFEWRGVKEENKCAQS